MSKKILTLDNVPVINKKIGKIDTIEKLKASTIYSLGDVVEVLGFHAKGDGSHHKRVAKAEDDGSGEEGQNGIWWCIVHNGEVNVSWFGAKGDGVTDDTVAIQKSVNINPSGKDGVLNFDSKKYIVSEEISVFNRALVINGNNANLYLKKSANYVLNIEGSSVVLSNITISKDKEITAKAIRLKGSRHRLYNVKSFNSCFGIFIDLESCWESSFEHIRVDGDVSNKTGIIFNFVDSTNNSISDSNFGFCNNAIKTQGGSEGILVDNCVIVYSKAAIQAVSSTALYLNNCVIDFCIEKVLECQIGQDFKMTNCWVANTSETSSSSAMLLFPVGFTGYNLSNNTFVNNSANKINLIASNSKNSLISQNYIKSFDLGTVNDATTTLYKNTFYNGSDVNKGNCKNIAKTIDDLHSSFYKFEFSHSSGTSEVYDFSNFSKDGYIEIGVNLKGANDHRYVSFAKILKSGTSYKVVSIENSEYLTISFVGSKMSVKTGVTGILSVSILCL